MGQELWLVLSVTHISFMACLLFTALSCAQVRSGCGGDSQREQLAASLSSGQKMG